MKNEDIDFSFIDTKATIASDHIEICHTPGSKSRNLLLCHHCGQGYVFRLGLTVEAFLDLVKHFEKHHKTCDKPVTKFLFTNWRRNNEFDEMACGEHIEENAELKRDMRILQAETRIHKRGVKKYTNLVVLLSALTERRKLEVLSDTDNAEALQHYRAILDEIIPLLPKK